VSVVSFFFLLLHAIFGAFSDGLRDYATWTNEQDNITSSAMGCDYKMVGFIIIWYRDSL
jgi:hypothetical protein